MPRRLVALALLALAPLAHAGAQDPLQRQVEEEIDHYDDADPEVRALIAWRLRAWLATGGEVIRQALQRAHLDHRPEARRLVTTILAAGDLRPPLDTLPPRADALLEALARPAPDDPLVATTAYLRFTDAVERTGDVDATLAVLKARAPDHAWVLALEHALSRRAVVRAVDRALRRLGQPERATRCEVAWLSPWWIDAAPDERVLRARGWLLHDDGERLEVYLDTLRRRTFVRRPLPPGTSRLGPLPRVEPLDVIAECEALLLSPGSEWDAYGDPGSLDHVAASMVRAAWMLGRGRPLLACRLVRAAELAWGLDSPAEALQESVRDLGASRWQAAIEALGASAPRGEVVVMLDAAIDVLSSAPGGPLGPAISDLRARALERRDQLARQAEDDRRRPPPPTWATWQAWSPDERLNARSPSCAIRTEAHGRRRTARPRRCSHPTHHEHGQARPPCPARPWPIA